MALPFWPKIVTSGPKENFARPPFPMATLAKPLEAIQMLTPMTWPSSTPRLPRCLRASKSLTRFKRS